MIGLDNSGKTTMIKRYASDLEDFHKSKDVIKSNNPSNPDLAFHDFYYTTPFINMERIKSPENQIPCIVYDMSG